MAANVDDSSDDEDDDKKDRAATAAAAKLAKAEGTYHSLLYRPELYNTSIKYLYITTIEYLYHYLQII